MKVVCVRRVALSVCSMNVKLHAMHNTLQHYHTVASEQVKGTPLRGGVSGPGRPSSLDELCFLLPSELHSLLLCVSKSISPLDLLFLPVNPEVLLFLPLNSEVLLFLLESAEVTSPELCFLNGEVTLSLE